MKALQDNCLENKFVRMNTAFCIWTNYIFTAFQASFSSISQLTFHFNQNFSKGSVAKSLRILHQ